MEAGQGGRRETTAEGEGQMDGPDTAPPTVMSGTGRPIDLRWPTDAAISKPRIIVKSNKSAFDLEI
jgi:hypothetical protein